jgi:hypothetical protein
MGAVHGGIVARGGIRNKWIMNSELGAGGFGMVINHRVTEGTETHRGCECIFECLM